MSKRSNHEGKRIIDYNFSTRHNRFELNVTAETALPLLVLKEPKRDSNNGKIVAKGVLLLGDYIIDDFIASYPNVKNDWIIISTTQSNDIPNNPNPDLHMYTTQTGEPSEIYQHGPAGLIPELQRTCGHFIDPEIFYPDQEIEKKWDLLYVSKWAPTKRIELVVEAAELDPTLKIAILAFPVVSERKRAESEQYRQIILDLIKSKGLQNITVIEHEQETHINPDGTQVIGGYSKEEMRVFYNQARSTILCSDERDGVNRSLAESLACDVPIMLTEDTLGGAHTLIEEESGLVIQTSGQAIVDAIHTLSQIQESLQPRQWYTQRFGRANSNILLRRQLAEIATVTGIPINLYNIRDYTGDPWGKDFYSSSIQSSKK